MPVLLGATTTFISASGLIGAPAEGFRIVLLYLTGVLVLGVIHGLVIIPVFLITTDEVVAYARIFAAKLTSLSSSNNKRQTERNGGDL